MTEMLSLLSSFRKQLPLPARMGYGWLKRKFVPHPIWDDDEFKRLYQWLQETQWWSRDQLEELQLEQLRAMVQHAYENVPYYRRVFDERRLKPKDISTLDDLQKLPLLTKEDVRKNSEDLIARNSDRRRLRYETTGGSTGVPLGVYHDKYTTDLREWAFILRQWGWVGYRFGDGLVTLRGNLSTRLQREGKRMWWDYNTDSNEVVLSPTDMSEENMYKYVELIKEFRPKFIYAVPSPLEILARFMRRNGVSDIGVKAVFCSSETLYPWQRELIESQFGCKVFDYYGLTEYVAGAAECERREGYHVNMEYGILELIDKDGEPITEAGTSGRVVGTGFGNHCMPLLRYSTDDLAEYASCKCSCKRESVVVRKFIGKGREFIVSKTGQIVPLIPWCTSVHTPIWGKIRELKFIQEREGELIARIVRVPSFSETEITQEFLKDFYGPLNEEEFSMKVEFVDRLPRTERGKIGFLEQKIPIELEDLDQRRSG
jgi:phenylacetate-CoA ligase